MKDNIVLHYAEQAKAEVAVPAFMALTVLAQLSDTLTPYLIQAKQEAGSTDIEPYFYILYITYVLFSLYLTLSKRSLKKRLENELETQKEIYEREIEDLTITNSRFIEREQDRHRLELNNLESRLQFQFDQSIEARVQDLRLQLTKAQRSLDKDRKEFEELRRIKTAAIDELEQLIQIRAEHANKDLRAELEALLALNAEINQALEQEREQLEGQYAQEMRQWLAEQEALFAERFAQAERQERIGKMTSGFIALNKSGEVEITDRFVETIHQKVTPFVKFEVKNHDLVGHEIRLTFIISRNNGGRQSDESNVVWTEQATSTLVLGENTIWPDRWMTPQVDEGWSNRFTVRVFLSSTLGLDEAQFSALRNNLNVEVGDNGFIHQSDGEQQGPVPQLSVQDVLDLI